MQTLALYSIKGGVGKTASAVNLAYLASLQGARTLLLDLDPQGAASFYCRVRPKVKGGSKAFVSGKRDLATLVKRTEFRGLDLLPADFRYRKLGAQLAANQRPRRRLRTALKTLKDYDCVVLDCPPGITLVAENVFQAADALLVPLIPSALSLRTFEQLHRFLRKHGTGRLAVWPFFCLVDRRKRIHLETIARFTDAVPQTLRTQIPYASDVERMGELKAPLPAFAGNSPSVLAYRGLWSEIRLRLGNPLCLPHDAVGSARASRGLAALPGGGGRDAAVG